MGDAGENTLAAVSARRARITVSLTVVMLVAYFGFIVMVGFAPTTAGRLLGGRVSLGIVVGAGVIVLAPLLVGLYVRWANRHYDTAIAAMRREPP